MDYLIGFFVGTTLMVVFYKFLIKYSLKADNKIAMKYSQSHIFNIVKPFASIVYGMPKPVIKTQTTEYEKSQTVRVIMTEGQAYWIRDNTFYTADINEDYSVDNDSTRTVDTMSMDKVQLDKIMFIVDRLTEDSDNDDSNSRNSWI
jgi:hypothetical protein